MAATSNGLIRVWSLTTGREIRVLKGHGKGVRVLKITLDGERVVSGLWDQTIRAWKLDTGAQEREIPMDQMINAIEIASDGEHIAVGLDDGSIAFIKLSTGSIRWLINHKNTIYGLAITPDGQWLASGSGDGTLALWHLPTGTLSKVENFNSPVGSAMIDPRGEKIILSILGGVGIYNLVNQQMESKIELHSGATAMALSKDARILVCISKKNLIVCDLETAQVQCVIPTPMTFNTVDITTDGLRAATGDSGGRVILWDLSTTQRAAVEPRSFAAIRALDLLSRDRLFSMSSDGIIKIWDASSAQEYQTINIHTNLVTAAAVFSNDSFVASGSIDKTVKIWDLKTGKLFRTFVGHDSAIVNISITENKKMISASRWGEVKVFSLEEGCEIRSYRVPNGYLTALAATLDGRLAVVGFQDDEDEGLSVLDLATGRVMGELHGHTGAVHTALIIPGCDRALTGSLDATIRMWDFVSCKELRRMEGHSDGIICLAVTPDGRYTASGSDDNTLRVWSLETGECLALFTGEGPISACAISPDARVVVAGESSGSLHFLRLESTRPAQYAFRQHLKVSRVP